jgi:hypothetical protein
MFARATLVLAFAVFVGGCNLKLGDSKNEQITTAKMEEFVSQEGKFKVKFPGKPDTQRQTIDVPARGKTFQLKVLMYSTMASNSGYTVGVAEAPLPGLIDPIETRILLEKGRDGAMEAVGGTVDSSKSILLQNRYQGLEITGRTAPPKGPSDGVFRGRIYLVEKRLYQAYAVGTGTFTTDARTNEFFESFQAFE